jgi:iron complex transport system substrate-binding protein
MWQEVFTVLIVSFALLYLIWRLSPLMWRFRPHAHIAATPSCQACAKHSRSLVGSALVLGAMFAQATMISDARAQHSVVDDTGVTLMLAAPARRIVSLAPGSTELLFAAGAGAQIVATVQGADEPAQAKDIERIGDANALQYNRLKALQPDVIVVWQGLANPTVIQSLKKLDLPLYFVSIHRFEDIPESIRRLGVLAGTSQAAEAAAKNVSARVARLPKAPAKPRYDVFYMIWDSPLYTVGNRSLMSDAISRCGGRNIFDDLDMPAPIVEFGVILGRNPDVIIMAAPPITSRDWRERWQGFPEVKAVSSKRMVSFTDTRLTRMGPTALDAVSDLCTLMEQLPD